MTAYNPAPSEMTINEMLQRGLLSETREGKLQKFFAAYNRWNPEVDDGQELQRLEHELKITPAEWAEYRASFAIEF